MFDGLLRPFQPALLADGDEAPAWNLLGSDGSFYAHDLRYWTLLVFFPDDSAATRAYLRTCAAMHTEFVDEGVRIYAVGDHTDIQGELPFPVLSDSDGSLARAYAASWTLGGIRTVYLLNPKRTVRFAARGTPDLTPALERLRYLKNTTRLGM